MKVALLASRRMVMGFLLGGVHVGYICENTEESRAHLDACLKDADVGIILVSRTVASMIPDRIHDLKNSSDMIPVISVIPDGPEPEPFCSG